MHNKMQFSLFVNAAKTALATNTSSMNSFYLMNQDAATFLIVIFPL